MARPQNYSAKFIVYSILTLIIHADIPVLLEVDILDRKDQMSPVGIQAKLGWVLSGPVGIPTQVQDLVTHTLCIESDVQALDDRLRSLWHMS